MRRAAVLLGVGRHPTLPPLHAVRPGLDEVAAWTREQGFVRVETLTDEEGPLAVRAVQDAIADIVQGSATDQLLVYFAGHGVNVGRREFWLLSDAPRYPNEAIDVARSAELAEACGIAHVVLVSDACRTAASGIGWQDVGGSPVFPNEDLGAPEGFVDRFHACALGSPAHEIAVVSDAVQRYHAVYTEALVDALRGEAEAALERDGTVGLVRPWPLREHLQEEVGRRLARLVPDRNLTQIPSAKIGSPPGSWLSRLEDVPPASRTRDVRPDVEEGLSTVVARAVDEHLEEILDGPTPVLRTAAELGVPGAAELLSACERVVLPFPNTGPDGSGLVVRGASLTDARTERFADPPRSIGQGAVDVRPTIGSLPVLVEFDDGTGVVLPVLRGYVTEVTVEDGEVVDVAFEPTWLRTDRERRSLRTLVSAASRFGVLTVVPRTVDALITAAADGGVVDPSLALHTAYALAGTPDRGRIAALVDRLDRSQLLDAFPDLMLLSPDEPPHRAPSTGTPIPSWWFDERTDDDSGDGGWSDDPFDDPAPVRPSSAAPWRRPARRSRILPPSTDVPLLAEGVLLRPPPEDPDPRLPDLRSHLVPSIWTQLTAEGVRLVRDARFSRRPA